MTRIGNIGAPEESCHDLQREPGGLPGGGTSRSRDGLGREMGRGQFELDAGAAGDRNALFLSKVRRALGENGTDDDGDGTDEQASRLLAVAGEPAALRLIDGLPATAGLVAGYASGRTAEVARLAERIEQSIKGEMAGNLRSGFRLRLDLQNAGDGPQSLTLTMTTNSIDVVLSSPEGGLSADYALAAQALADRLQARFSRRVVRIYEANAENELRASHGLDEISSLLAGRGGGS